ncbi:MAG: HAD hydrolase family protein [Candidatus Omnitrophica bacterium]|nr:HAD hydrolase family protein [Candidatus Omnitrophota bacterium]
MSGLKRLKKIKVLAMDVDGVMTDGRIVYDGDGKELKFFDVRDGYGIARIRKAGLKTAVISARGCRAVKARTDDLKIDKVYLGVSPKVTAYGDMLEKFHVKDDEVCFIGDDLPDFEILSRVGFAVAVSNAAPELKGVAHYVTRCHGGRGAVREVVEKILKAQGKWTIK